MSEPRPKDLWEVPARTLGAVVFSCATLLLVIWASIALQLRAERESVLDHAFQSTTNYARVFEEHVERTVRSADLTLRDIESAYRREGRNLNLARYAADHRMFLDPYNILSIADEHGDQILASWPFKPQNFKNRATFRWHETHNISDLVIGRPHMGKATGKWSMYISRRLDKPDGSFGGVVAIGLDPLYFSRFYDQIHLGKDAVVVLLGRDGVIRARKSNETVSTGQDMSRYEDFHRMLSSSSGTFVTRLAMDGVDRIFSYRALKDYPLIVQVGVSEAATLAPYRRLRAQFIAWGGLITAIILFFAGLVTVQAARQARTGKALHASEAQLRAIWNAEPECVKLLDPQCRVLEINPAGVAMAEAQSAGELRGKSMLEVVDPAYHAAFRDMVAKVFDGESGRLAYALIGLKGTRRWMDIRSVPLHDAQQPERIAAMLGVTRDVTEQKHVQDELVASRKLLQDILNSMYAFVGLFSLDGTLVQVNEAPFAVRGIAREDTIGKPLWETYWWAHSPTAQARLRDALACAGRGETVRYDETIRRREGTFRNVDIQLGPLRNAAGEVVQVVGFGIDITERKRAEAERAHLAYIVQTSDDAIMSRSLDHRILSWNGGAERLFGYSTREALGKDVALLIASETLALYYARREDVSAGLPVMPHEAACVTKDGRRIDVSVRPSTVRNEFGEVIAVSLIMRDITDRKTAEAELKRLNAELEDRVAERTRELEAANAELGAFSYSVSHDLRAPLRAIQGFSALVLNKSRPLLDAETVSRLERVCDNAERMGMLIDDLLRLSRVSQREIDRRGFDLSRLALEVTGGLRRMDPQRRVDVSVQPGMLVNADQTLVQLVLDNLIGNAWKFTSRTPHASIEIAQEPRDGNMVFYVRDNGAGFDMRYADKLFNAFQRLHHRAEFDGTGIGLSIVHRVISKHGGTVWADAKVGEGATFYFTLG